MLVPAPSPPRCRGELVGELLPQVTTSSAASTRGDRLKHVVDVVALYLGLDLHPATIALSVLPGGTKPLMVVRLAPRTPVRRWWARSRVVGGGLARLYPGPGYWREPATLADRRRPAARRVA
jgi:hypothetical protein